MLPEEAIFLNWGNPRQDVGHLTRVYRAEKGGRAGKGVLVIRQDEDFVAVLPPCEGDLNWCHILHEEMMDVLDSGLIRFLWKIGEVPGHEYVDDGVDW